MRSLRLAAAMLTAAPSALARQARLEGVVYDSLRARAPLVGATVSIREVQRFATTDASGRFVVESLAPGRYTVDVQHELLDSLEIQLPGVAVDVSNGARQSVMLGIPSARGLQRLLCTESASTGSSVLIGTVRSLDGQQPKADALVQVDWNEALLERSGMRQRDRQVSVRTAASGAFLLCGVPSDADLRITTIVPGAATARLDSRADSLGFRRVDIRVGSGAGVTRFRARAADGTPLPDAMLRIHGVAAIRTDSLGEGSATLDAGTHSVDVVALGYAPTAMRFTVRPDSVNTLDVPLTRNVVALDAVRVVGRYELLNMRLDEFESRRRVGMGTFIGPRELMAQTSTELVDVVRAARGVRVVSGGAGISWPLLRGGEAQCIPNFFVNGIHFPVNGPRAPAQYPYTDLIGAVPLESILAIEVYAGVGNIPAKYDRTSQNGCGTILIWTK